ncbi:MAG: LytTR family DNA-binding domain-containing protein [Bacteroidales bacterium]|jgi:hypothetical protein|nr:LytTR family DNA-binding domain-containing protein [Bacteroidales bacterium]
MINKVARLLSSESLNSTCSASKLWNHCVVKGFAVGPIWVVPLLAALSHIFMDIRFEPYGFAFYPTNVKIILSLIYGVVMGGGFYLALSLLPNASKPWALWKEVLWLFITVFLITNLNYVFRHLLFYHVFHITYLYPVSYFRFLLVGAEVAGITALTFEFIQFVLIKSGMYIFPQEFIPIAKPKENLVTVRGKGKKDQLSFHHEAFVYAQSEGNYMKIFYFSEKGGLLESEMLRLSIQDLLKQLSGLDDIVRIHKSFVFNFSQAYVLIGNSRRANLKILALDIEIPVSRAFYNEHQRDS